MNKNQPNMEEKVHLLFCSKANKFVPSCVADADHNEQSEEWV